MVVGKMGGPPVMGPLHKQMDPFTRTYLRMNRGKVIMKRLNETVAVSSFVALTTDKRNDVG